jgi:hypothetical protein
MDIGALRTLAFTAACNTFGVDATVTPPSGSPIVARGIWTQPLTEEMPTGHDFTRRDPRRVLAFRIAETGSIKRGSSIVAPEYGGGSARTWKVDGVEREDMEQIRVIVTPA